MAITSLVCWARWALKGQSAGSVGRLHVMYGGASSVANMSVPCGARSGALDYGDGASEPCDDPF